MQNLRLLSTGSRPPKTLLSLGRSVFRGYAQHRLSISHPIPSPASFVLFVVAVVSTLQDFCFNRPSKHAVKLPRFPASRPTASQESGGRDPATPPQRTLQKSPYVASARIDQRAAPEWKIYGCGVALPQTFTAVRGDTHRRLLRMTLCCRSESEYERIFSYLCRVELKICI